MNTVNECLNAMLEADRDLYTSCINRPEFATAFNAMARLAGEREELIVHLAAWFDAEVVAARLIGTDRYFDLKAKADENEQHLRALVARYKGE